MRIILVAAAVSMLLITALCRTALTGGNDPQLDEFNAHCSDDAHKYCSGISSGQGRLFTCLRNNKEKISEGCDDYLSGKLRSVMSSFLSFRSNCGDDYSKYCKNVERGEGRVIRCLWMHSPDISAECLKQITPFRLFQY